MSDDKDFELWTRREQWMRGVGYVLLALSVFQIARVLWGASPDVIAPTLPVIALYALLQAEVWQMKRIVRAIVPTVYKIGWDTAFDRLRDLIDEEVKRR